MQVHGAAEPGGVPAPHAHPPRHRPLLYGLVHRLRSHLHQVHSLPPQGHTALLSISTLSISSVVVVVQELSVAGVAAVFMGIGTLFLMLWVGIYV